MLPSFGTENLDTIIDKSRKKFPIPKEDIKRKALEIKGFIEAKEAYMYEDKEGLQVSVSNIWEIGDATGYGSPMVQDRQRSC